MAARYLGSSSSEMCGEIVQHLNRENYHAINRTTAEQPVKAQADEADGPRKAVQGLADDR